VLPEQAAIDVQGHWKIAICGLPTGKYNDA